MLPLDRDKIGNMTALNVACRMLETRLIRPEEAAEVQRVLESNAGYSQRVSGGATAPDAGQAVLTALPPGVDTSRKIDLGLWEDERLVAFADVILFWPDPTTAHIGLLVTDGTREGQGLGRLTHKAVLEMLRAHPPIRTLRLSVVDTNAEIASPFWMALGYRLTGEAVPYTSGSVESIARVWSRPVNG